MLGRKKRNKTSAPQTRLERIGGLGFLFSVVVLVPVSLVFFYLAIMQAQGADYSAVLAFSLATLTGAMVASFGFREHLSVMIHEFKHSLVSSIVGNKHKRLVVHKDSGSYEYTYTKDTAHFNALIALAPYIVPLFTIIAVILAVASFRDAPLAAIVAIGFGYGIDIVMNLRDISPIQTDISLIRGGFKVGLMYIIAWNVLIAALVLALTFSGPSGVYQLFEISTLGVLSFMLPLFGHKPGL